MLPHLALKPLRSRRDSKVIICAGHDYQPVLFTLRSGVTKCQNPWVRQTLASAEMLLPPFPLHPLRHSEMLSTHVEYLQPS